MNSEQLNTHTAFVLAAPKSNSGKTIISLGLMQALKQQGYSVQAFKCGPDYIDTMHHTAVLGKPSYNLDLWMSSPEHVKSLFLEKSSSANISIIEGVMGLFDGANKSKGSTAELAKFLNLPIILVVDASSAAYSLAPLLFGFKNFDKDINLAGVIFNKVAGEGHYSFLKDAAIDAGVNPLGYIPRNEKLKMESRHLGLQMPHEKGFTEPVNKAAQLIEEHIDLTRIIGSCSLNKDFKEYSEINPKPVKEIKTIAIAQDAAFNFMYPANIDALKPHYELSFFSPLNDNEVPVSDLLWFPGGYPELYAEQLANNTSLINSIKQHVRHGGKVIAECGGLMYLGKQLIDTEKKSHKMCGLFDYTCSMSKQKLTLGYRSLTIDDNTFKGHEFHYSELIADEIENTNYQTKTARNAEISMPVFHKNGIWASYLHLYLGEPEKMQQFLKNLSNY